MERILKLHEAIAVVLLSKENRTATLEEISEEISDRRLYYKKDGSFADQTQIRLRTHPNTKGGKTYAHLFEFIEPNRVNLKNI